MRSARFFAFVALAFFLSFFEGRRREEEEEIVLRFAFFFFSFSFFLRRRCGSSGGGRRGKQGIGIWNGADVWGQVGRDRGFVEFFFHFPNSSLVFFTRTLFKFLNGMFL